MRQVRESHSLSAPLKASYSSTLACPSALLPDACHTRADSYPARRLTDAAGSFCMRLSTNPTALLKPWKSAVLGVCDKRQLNLFHPLTGRHQAARRLRPKPV